ncbi:MAG: hypothetical protein QXS42_07345 [Zestosphaera sp.]
MATLIITTSREPSRRTRSFVNDLVRVVPNSLRFNRGKATYKDLALLVKRQNSRGVLMVMERKGNPSALKYLIPGSGQASLKTRYVVLIRSLKLLREVHEAQTPFNVDKLLLNASRTTLQGLLHEVYEVFTEIFNPELTSERVASTEAIELIIAGNGDDVNVSFYCTSTGRPCGPMFRVLKVIKADESAAPIPNY